MRWQWLCTLFDVPLATDPPDDPSERDRWQRAHEITAELTTLADDLEQQATAQSHSDVQSNSDAQRDSDAESAKRLRMGRLAYIELPAVLSGREIAPDPVIAEADSGSSSAPAAVQPQTQTHHQQPETDCLIVLKQDQERTGPAQSQSLSQSQSQSQSFAEPLSSTPSSPPSSDGMLVLLDADDDADDDADSKDGRVAAATHPLPGCPLAISADGQPVDTVIVSPDQAIAGIARSGDMAAVLDGQIQQWRHAPAITRAIGLQRNGPVMITAEGGGHLTTRAWPSGELGISHQPEDTAPVQHLVTDPTGELCATSHSDHGLCVHSVASLTTLQELVVHPDEAPHAVVFTPGSDGLIVGSSLALTNYRLSDGLAAWQVATNDDTVATLAVSADGRLVCVGYDSGRVEVRQPWDGQVVATMTATDAVTAAACAGHGGWVAIADDAGCVQVLQPDTLAPIATVQVSVPISVLAASASGHVLAAGTDDGWVWAWRIPDGVADPDSTTDHERLRGHCRAFIIRHRPLPPAFATTAVAGAGEFQPALSRAEQANWDDQAWRGLLRTLAHVGLEHFQPEQVADVLAQQQALLV